MPRPCYFGSHSGRGNGGMASAPKGGKEPASDTIFAPQKMKPLLAKSKQEPVQAAIGLTSDGEGLILLNARMKPKKVLATLRAEASKAKVQLNTATLRFGRAEVDTEYDAGTVRFFVNKEAPGNMRARLIEVVKRASYQKVEINVDPDLELESDDDEEASDGPIPPAPPQLAATSAAAQGNGVAAPEAPDARALSAELAVLARRIPAASGDDAARKARLLKLATDANVNVKANN